MDRPVGAGGDRSDRNGPGCVGPDLGLVNPSRGPAAGLAELAGGRVPGTATRSPVARRGATTPPDGKFGAPLPASSAASADPLARPGTGPSLYAMSWSLRAVARRSTRWRRARRTAPVAAAPAAALLVDPSTRPAWRPSARVRDVTWVLGAHRVESPSLSPGWTRSSSAVPRNASSTNRSRPTPTASVT
jgi:hypothetical protein